MELKSKVQELEMLEIEIPALVETKEGKLLGARMLVKTNVSLVVRSLLLRPRTRHRLHQPNL